MSTTMRAKFTVSEVAIIKPSHPQALPCQKITMYPVTNSKYGENGENEDNTFARYTPSGEIRLQVTNPELMDKINPGETYYIDFSPVEQ